MAGILFALALFGSSPCADTGRAVEPPPAPPPLDANTWYGSLYDWAGGYEAAPLGVGHLALERRENTLYLAQELSYRFDKIILE